MIELIRLNVSILHQPKKRTDKRNTFYICSIMNPSVDINNREELRRLLLTLDPAAVPVWGKMTPQQMVEHLVDQVQWTNGKKIPACDVSAEKAERSKRVMIYTDAQIPKNVILEIGRAHV